MVRIKLPFKIRWPFRKDEVKVLTPNPEEEKWFTKDRLLQITTQLKVQAEKLNRTNQRLTSRGRNLFEQCVQATQEKDSQRAAMYANEIAQLRRMSRVLLRSQLSLEQVVLRLETVKEFGDVMTALGPAISIVQQIQGELTGVVPEVASGLARVDEMLDSLLIEAGGISGEVSSVSVQDEEAKKIMQEASEIAAQRMRAAFPELPEPYRHLEEAREPNHD